ncbi:MAG TPA: PIG-L family deacetylase, partial [Bacteroidia bacterium]|nr:PIG-L family deacetylase [Bacteroidia bacterium]
MTNLLRKICQRLTDPFCYRKWIRVLLRGFRSFDDGGAGLESGCFRGLRHATVVIAHPDDESFCSGLICALKQQGTTVAVLCMTKGEGGPAGGHPREQLGQVREQEMRKACEELKVDELVFLGHIDPLGGEYRVFAPEVSAADLADQLLPHLEKTGLIISHGSSGEYWHPGHILVYEAVK